MEDMKRFHRLIKMAEQDANYRAFKMDYEVCGKKIEKFLKWCPKRIQYLFQAYAVCDKMMNQRILNIACANMEFMDVLQEEIRPTGEKKES